MTAAAPHRPSCICGGSGLIDGLELTSTLDQSEQPRTYRQLIECPGRDWPTPPPKPTDAAAIGRAGIAAARAALENP